MSDEDVFPPDDKLHANAWCGTEASGELDPTSDSWGVRRDVPKPRQKLAPKEIDLANWEDPEVGWGVILPDDKNVLGQDKHRGADAAEPIRKLIAHRGNAPVFRYRKDVAEGRLRFYAADGKPSDISMNGARGTGPGAVPRYLLIVGGPKEIPWRFHYRLQTNAFVGRLDLDADGLGRYVEYLIKGWPADTSRTTPVIWATDHGHPDITRLMRKGIAEKLAQKFKADAEFDMQNGFLVDGLATHAKLAEALVQRKPGFIMTSSHGATYPLNNPEKMGEQIGLLMDNDHGLMDHTEISGAWDVAGGIWYAHACCSAGTDAQSAFEKLVAPDSSLAKTLAAIANVGATTAPLPQLLLSREKPVRAFLGHVEPTFDWTLRDPVTGQLTTAHIVSSLYGKLHQAKRPPLGLALASYFEAVAGLLQDHADAIDGVNAGEEGSVERARRSKLMAIDRLSMVILGDPTVSLG